EAFVRRGEIAVSSDLITRSRIIFVFIFFFLLLRRPPISTLFPYTTLFRSVAFRLGEVAEVSVVIMQSAKIQAGLFDGVNQRDDRSEEHTSELQSPYDLVCRLLLEKKKQL